MSIITLFLLRISVSAFLMLMIYIYNSKNNYHHTLNPCLSIDDNNKYNCKKSCDGSAHNYNGNNDN